MVKGATQENIDGLAASLADVQAVADNLAGAILASEIVNVSPASRFATQGDVADAMTLITNALANVVESLGAWHVYAMHDRVRKKHDLFGNEIPE